MYGVARQKTGDSGTLEPSVESLGPAGEAAGLSKTSRWLQAVALYISLCKAPGLCQFLAYHCLQSFGVLLRSFDCLPNGLLHSGVLSFELVGFLGLGLLLLLCGCRFYRWCWWWRSKGFIGLQCASVKRFSLRGAMYEVRCRLEPIAEGGRSAGVWVFSSAFLHASY